MELTIDQALEQGVRKYKVQEDFKTLLNVIMMTS